MLYQQIHDGRGRDELAQAMAADLIPSFVEFARPPELKGQALLYLQQCLVVICGW